MVVHTHVTATGSDNDTKDTSRTSIDSLLFPYDVLSTKLACISCSTKLMNFSKTHCEGSKALSQESEPN
jgi:hypothetical protein